MRMAESSSITRIVADSAMALGVDHFVADSVANEIGDRVEIEFAQNAGAMGLGRPNADAECFRDLFVAFSFCNELHDLPLACAETLAGFGFVASAFGAVEDVRKENLGDFRGKKRLVPAERFNRFHQKLVRFGFRDEALYSGLERVPNQLVALMRGEHEDLCARQFSF